MPQRGDSARGRCLPARRPVLYPVSTDTARAPSSRDPRLSGVSSLPSRTDPLSFSLLVLNGPNLNLLGTRQPEVYGRRTLDDIAALCQATADELGVDLDFRQSNHEGELITWIQEARNLNDGLILNPAALTHTSVGLLDALLAAELPTIEVHLSNLHRREEFRRHSVTAQAALGVIAGLGAEGYRLALIALTRHLQGQIADPA